MDDAELQPLIARAARGDENAFAEIYDRTAPRVFGLLRRMVGAERAEEVVQEVFVQVWRTSSSFDARRASAWAWIALIARSRALDRLRADGSYRATLEGVGVAPERRTGGDGARDPGHAAELSERGRLVREALDGLPAEQREAIEKAFFDGLSHREIADGTRTPLGTVKSRIRAGIERLRDQMASSIGEDQ